MEKEFIPYEQALALKELGFDEPCFKCKVIGQEHLDYTPTDYDDFPEQKEKEVLIPTFSQAFRWFREKYKLYCCIERVEYINSDEKGFQFSIFEKYSNVGEELKTYEEAELECLNKIIEIVKEQKVNQQNNQEK